MAKFGINDILNAKTKAAGQQAQGYKEIYLSPYEVKAAEENTHQKLEGIEELADSFLHVGQEQPTVLATLTKAATIYNTEGFTATPYIKITGSGGITLYINNRAHTFKDVNEYIEIDGEIMNAYKGDLLQNSKMVTELFPKLTAGANNISWAGNVTKVEIIPRWCRL